MSSWIQVWFPFLAVYCNRASARGRSSGVGVPKPNIDGWTRVQFEIHLNSSSSISSLQGVRSGERYCLGASIATCHLVCVELPIIDQIDFYVTIYIEMWGVAHFRFSISVHRHPPIWQVRGRYPIFLTLQYSSIDIVSSR